MTWRALPGQALAGPRPPPAPGTAPGDPRRERRTSPGRGRSPAGDELAVLLGATEDDIREARKAGLAFSASSLDAPMSDKDDGAPLSDMLGEDDQAVEHAIDVEAVRTHLDDLPGREQRILNLRFYGNLTQAEIGQRLGISQMHVSRLLARALGYLRHQRTWPEHGDGRRAAAGSAAT